MALAAKKLHGLNAVLDDAQVIADFGVSQRFDSSFGITGAVFHQQDFNGSASHKGNSTQSTTAFFIRDNPH